MIVHVISHIVLLALVVMTRFRMTSMTVLLLDAKLTYLFEALRAFILLTIFICRLIIKAVSLIPYLILLQAIF